MVFIVLDMSHRVIPNPEWLSSLSPIYYYNLSKPLIPSFGINAGGMLVMLALAVVLTAAGIWLFVRRDVGDVVHLPFILRLTRDKGPTTPLPVAAWSLGSVYPRRLRL